MAQLTKERAKELVEKAVDRFPDRRNPRGYSGLCVYTSWDDPTVHCIIGQVLADAGLPVPPSQVEMGFLELVHDGEDDALRKGITEEAIAWLNAIQSCFDYHMPLVDGSRTSRFPATWEQAWEYAQGHVK